jgi:hypothetical protein
MVENLFYKIKIIVMNRLGLGFYAATIVLVIIISLTAVQMEMENIE